MDLDSLDNEVNAGEEGNNSPTEDGNANNDNVMGEQSSETTTLQKDSSASSSPTATTPTTSLVESRHSKPEATAIDEAVSGKTIAQAQSKTIVVPSGASQQPAFVAAAALGIPVSALRSNGGGGANVVTVSCGATSGSNQQGGSGSGSGGGVTFVPVVAGGRRVLLQTTHLLGGSASTSSGGGGANSVVVNSEGAASGMASQQTVILPQQPQAPQAQALVSATATTSATAMTTATTQQMGLLQPATGTVFIQQRRPATTTQVVTTAKGARVASGTGEGSVHLSLKAADMEQLVAVSAVGDNRVANSSTSSTVVPARVVILPQHLSSHQGSSDSVSVTATRSAAGSSSSPSQEADNSNSSSAAATSNNNASNNELVAVSAPDSPPAVFAVTVDSSSTTEQTSGNNKMFDPGCSYTTLTSPHNGRMTPPGYTVANSYATLTPLQPLPPISTISSMQDKFHQAYSPGANVPGTFVMQNNLPNISLGSPYAYDKLAMSPPPYSQNGPAHGAGASTNSGSGGSEGAGGPSSNLGNGSQPSHSPSALSPQGSYSQSEIHSKQEPLSPSASAAAAAAAAAAAGAYFDPAQRPTTHDLSPPHSIDTHSPTGGSGSGHPYSSQALTSGNNPTLNGGLTSVSPQTISPVPHHSPGGAHRELSPPSPTPHHPNAHGPSAIISSLHNSVNAVQLHHGQVLHHLHQGQQHVPQVPSSTAMITLKSTSSSGSGNSAGANNAASNNASAAAAAASSAGDGEEINTKELAQRISAELKRYSIPQAIFAQRVLCRSQGTLSDLLRNPKPWSKLKSGRETFRRMAKWLQEPEFQRMSALRLAGKRAMNRHSTCVGNESRDEGQKEK